MGGIDENGLKETGKREEETGDRKQETASEKRAFSHEPVPVPCFLSPLPSFFPLSSLFPSPFFLFPLHVNNFTFSAEVGGGSVTATTDICTNLEA